jgi:protein transport protein SEC31
MKLKEISRTATFAWSSSSSSGGELLPLLATGTVSGALDETFSNVGQLEIWQPNWLGGSDEGIELGLDGGKGPRAKVQTTARYVLLRRCLR